MGVNFLAICELKSRVKSSDGSHLQTPTRSWRPWSSPEIREDGAPSRRSPRSCPAVGAWKCAGRAPSWTTRRSELSRPSRCTVAQVGDREGGGGMSNSQHYHFCAITIGYISSKNSWSPANLALCPYFDKGTIYRVVNQRSLQISDA